MTIALRQPEKSEAEALDRIMAQRVAFIVEQHGLHTPVRAIAEEVAAAASIHVSLILSQTRDAPIAELRQLVMWRAHRAGVGFSAIGRALGRDHTTVMHGVRAEEARQRADQAAAG